MVNPMVASAFGLALASAVDVVGKVVIEPVKLISEWCKEPLRVRENDREVRRERDSRILEVELEIKRKTEVQRVLSEIEELRKDKDFERMKKVSDAIMEYQERLTHLNVHAISAIGSMQLDLREKAQKLVREKAIQYQEMQTLAHAQATTELAQIEETFAGNERAKELLYRSVEQRLFSIIDTAAKFLIELNNDIAVLNKSINLLTEQGQEFIRDHLGKFHVIADGQMLASDQESVRQLK